MNNKKWDAKHVNEATSQQLRYLAEQARRALAAERVVIVGSFHPSGDASTQEIAVGVSIRPPTTARDIATVDTDLVHVTAALIRDHGETMRLMLKLPDGRIIDPLEQVDAITREFGR